MRDIYFCMPIGDCYGWGVCGRNLSRELDKRVNLKYVFKPYKEITGLITEEDMSFIQRNETEITGDVASPMIITISNDPGEHHISYKGKPHIGYLFIEWDVHDKYKEHLKHYDIVVAGSDWNAKLLRDEGIRCVSIPQGIDREVFKPKNNRMERFTIFSGGKWEPRKGQDLVIRAVSKFQEMYDDIDLITSWGNVYDPDVSIKDMKRALNDYNLKNLIQTKLLNHKEMSDVMNSSHIGLFPNRVEGGTNLVMMEYMACGKPVIANDSTGQADVMDDSYAFRINGTDDELVDQMVERLEYAYENFVEMTEMGVKASNAMNEFTWGKMADRFLELCDGKIT